MFSFIRGKIAELNPAYAVLENNGIGYLLNITLNTYGNLQQNKESTLLTHLVVREDAFVLYGFFDEKERKLFRQLITVSGVGASTSQLILSSLTPDEVYQAIVNEDVAALKSVKGIGLKSAQRIIVDLKDKLSRDQTSTEILKSSYNTKKDEALSGLIILGFNKSIAEKTLDRIIREKGSSLSVEELIKNALKIL